MNFQKKKQNHFDAINTMLELKYAMKHTIKPKSFCKLSN